MADPYQQHKWHSTPQTIVAAITAIIIVAAVFYSVANGSLTHIYVAGIPVKASDSQSRIQRSIDSGSKNYVVKVKYIDGSSKPFPVAATGISIDSKQSAINARRQINNSFAQRLAWWKPINISLVTHSDNKIRDAFIATNLSQISQAPVDASLSLDGGVVTINPDKVGSGSTISKPNQALNNQIANLTTRPLALRSTVFPVAITAKDLAPSKAKAEAILAKAVVFNIAGHSVTATPEDIAGWVDISAVPKDKTADVNVNSGKVLQYINGVAKRYIGLPRSRLVTNTSAGQVVLDPGEDGVDVVDKDKTAASVAQRLTKEPSLNIDLAVQYTAAKTVEAQAADKWFVADITNKRMYAYEGTNLVHSFLVSAGAPATPTVTGQYKIYAKFASQDMTGDNADGSRYNQPAVPYVNYFYGGYAIHGNYWRPSSYFGNINSSHGCIGTNVGDAAWIYDWAPIGTPVIVHS